MSASNFSEHSTQPFAYDVSDLRALNWQVVPWWRLGLSLAIFSFLVWFFVSLMLEDGDLDWVLVAILCLIAGVFAGPWTWHPFIAHRSMRRENLLERHVIRIEPEHFAVHSAKAEARIRWSAISKIRRKSDRLFLFSSKSIAHIIPRRAFESDADFDAFVQAAEDRWKQSHRL